MTTSHIKLAAVLADRLYQDGLLPRPSAEWLFDVLADALEPEQKMASLLMSEIEFAREAFSARINARELWADLELPSDDTK
jgi:hypothetical protein